MGKVVDIDEFKSALEKMLREQAGAAVRVAFVCHHPRYRAFKYPTHTAKVCESCGFDWVSIEEPAPARSRLGVVPGAYVDL